MTPADRDVEGLAVRRLAVTLWRNCNDKRATVEEAVAGSALARALAPRDRAFVSSLLLTAFRHRGVIDAVLSRLLDRPLPRKSGVARDILVLGTAQLLFLGTPAHAVIDLAVRTAKADRNALHFAGLVNAVLRKVAAGGPSLLDDLDAPRLNTPDWLWQSWTAAYGEDTTRRIARSHGERPGLDLSFRTDAAAWSDALGGQLLPNGQLRLAAGHAPVTELPGFAEGAWWIQDAAATLPVWLMGELAGKNVLDLCAAPGGKTLQLAAMGAKVTALDVSEHRLERLSDNLQRSALAAEIVTADIFKSEWPDQWDAVLLDAPCTATGTIRRHPELPYLRDPAEVKVLSGVQRRMLHRAAGWVKPGGLLAYCTCSLEPEEGEVQARTFLARHEEYAIVPAAGDWLPEGSMQPEGWVRTLPCMRYGESQGMDGFFIVVMRRAA